MNSQIVGSLGHIGHSLDPDYNKLVDEANKLVNEFNLNVGSLHPDIQFNYQQETLDKIDRILKNEKFEEKIIKYHSPQALWGQAVTYVRIDKIGRMWVGNGEYETQVNYCPYTGVAAPVKMMLLQVVNDCTYYS